MEIERKFLIENLPANLDSYQCLLIEQAYLCTDPVIRIRRQNNEYYLTYKGKGLMARQEYNLPLNESAYRHLLAKADGNIISKKRYVIPIAKPVFTNGFSANARSVPRDSGDSSDSEKEIELKIELDVFNAPFSPLMIAEVEFPDEEMANAFIPPEWLGEDVTLNIEYHNSTLSKKIFKN